MAKPKLIVASTRLPVTMARRQDRWEVAPSTGGLVTALKSVKEQRGFTWLGWPGAHVPEAERGALTRELARNGASPVFITKAHMDGFYQNFSNEVLWPLFHNMTDRSHFDRSGWKSYQIVPFPRRVPATGLPASRSCSELPPPASERPKRLTGTWRLTASCRPGSAIRWSIPLTRSASSSSMRSA
jgi:hypothetical protein